MRKESVKEKERNLKILVSSSKQQLDVCTYSRGLSMSDIDNIETALKSITEVKVDIFLPAPFYYDSIAIS